MRDSRPVLCHTVHKVSCQSLIGRDRYQNPLLSRGVLERTLGKSAQVAFARGVQQKHFRENGGIRAYPLDLE
jgi:hypothetical protein